METFLDVFGMLHRENGPHLTIEEINEVIAGSWAGRAMRITADTNLLIRVIVADDPIQAALAQRQLANADLVALPVVALCEMVWTLSRAYNLKKSHVALALRTLVNSS